MALLTLFCSGPALVCLLCLLIFLVSYFSVSARKPALKLPPGPKPLPIIGNLHLLDIKRQDKSLMKFAKAYGPVYTLHFGSQKAIILTGYEAVRDALVNFQEEFVDRPLIPIFEEIQHGNGVFFSTGELWRTTRRFTMASMRNLGVGKKVLEGQIIEELCFLIESIKAFEGEPFELRTFNTAPTNITFAMLFGSRFDYRDPVFLTLLRLIDEVMCLLGSPLLHLFNFYPFLGFLFTVHKTLLQKVEEVRVIIRDYIKTSKQEVRASSPRSYTDALVLKQQEDTSKQENLFHDDNLIASILDLVMAGTETTATTLQWAVLLMMKYPSIQEKVQEELRCVLDPGAWASYEDRNKLPYTNAVIHEIQRFITLLPHVPRCTSVDTHFRGYLIPKGTTVIPSLTSVLLDPDHWETPHKFNPSHFLDDDGKFVKKEAFMPYSMGRRNCMGETLAKTELFLFFAGLLQKFTFQPPPGVPASDIDLSVPKTTFTLRPRPQLTCAISRE